MEKNDKITREEFDASLAGIAATIGLLTTTVSALTLILREVKIVNPASWSRHLDAEAFATWNRKLAEAREKMNQNSAIANALRDFQGPLQ